MAVLASPATNAAAAQCSARSGPELRPLVELYTSEGCSSCPPADRWLSTRVADDHPQANYLAYHVDYWDDLGWPDRFASPQFSARQRQRVGAQGDSTVYTPQVMVGREIRAHWRNPGRWERALQDAASPSPGAALSLRMTQDGPGWRASLGASPIGTPAKGARVWLARYADDRSTRVRAGENRGVRLHHDRAVTVLHGPWSLGRETLSRQVRLPTDPEPWGLVAFVESADGRILQSLALPASECR